MKILNNSPRPTLNLRELWLEYHFSPLPKVDISKQKLLKLFTNLDFGWEIMGQFNLDWDPTDTRLEVCISFWTWLLTNFSSLLLLLVWLPNSSRLFNSWTTSKSLDSKLTSGSSIGLEDTPIWYIQVIFTPWFGEVVEPGIGPLRSISFQKVWSTHIP